MFVELISYIKMKVCVCVCVYVCVCVCPAACRRTHTTNHPKIWRGLLIPPWLGTKLGGNPKCWPPAPPLPRPLPHPLLLLSARDYFTFVLWNSPGQRRVAHASWCLKLNKKLCASNRKFHFVDHQSKSCERKQEIDSLEKKNKKIVWNLFVDSFKPRCEKIPPL
jgi:hypothetical protein